MKEFNDLQKEIQDYTKDTDLQFLILDFIKNSKTIKLELINSKIEILEPLFYHDPVYPTISELILLKNEYNKIKTS
jgi:hypothetical protein